VCDSLLRIVLGAGLTLSRISLTAAKLVEYWRRYSLTALSALLSSGGLGRLGVVSGTWEVMLREPMLSSSAGDLSRAIAGCRTRRVLRARVKRVR